MKFNVLHQSFLIFVAVICLSLPCFSQNQNLKLTAENKSEIITSVLNQFFEDYPDDIDSDEAVLSSLNVNSLPVSPKFRVKLILLNPDEINARVRRNGFVDYLFFSQFKVKGSKVFVTLENQRLVEYNSEIIPRIGHGFQWKVRMKSGRWVAECINTSAFVTETVTTGEGN